MKKNLLIAAIFGTLVVGSAFGIKKYKCYIESQKYVASVLELANFEKETVNLVEFEKIDSKSKELALDLIKTMHFLEQDFLTSAQVIKDEEHVKIIVIKLNGEEVVAINPEIIYLNENEIFENLETSISLPGKKAAIKRSKHIKISYFNLKNEKIEGEFFEDEAILWQKAVDHLDSKKYSKNFEKKEIVKKSAAASKKRNSKKK